MDVAAGTRWRAELNKSLDAATSAVVCLTPATLASPWVQFETGALSVLPLCARICPYLIDVEPDEVRGPLGDFQSRQANEEGSWDLLTALNHVLAEPLGEGALKSRFVKCWPSLKADIAASPVERARPNTETYNKLDSVGVQSLLQIHFSASANRLTHVFDQSLEEFSDDPSKLNFDLLVINATRVLDEGRHLLAPFSSEVTGPLPTFLDECLPATKLGERLRRGLEIVSKYPQAERRRVAAIK